MTSLWQYLSSNRDEIGGWAETTIWLAAAPVAAGFLLALPVGWFASRYRRAHLPLVSASGLLYTIPSLVLILALPGLLGTKILDPLNVAVALTIYAFALLARTVADGLSAVSPEILSAAAAMGQTGRQRLIGVQLPLAVPVIAAGLRVAAVSNISLVSVASIIGTPQLGQLFIAGNNVDSLTPIALGLIFFIALALALDVAILGAAAVLSPWHRAAAG
jgi:osmoprotectant transport system permease protein